jgi:hypothetical protein
MRSRRRTRREDAGETGPGRFERIMLSFMGPPQLGDVHAESTVVPDPAQALCHKCRRPWDEHEIVRTGSMTYARCPHQTS